MYKVKHKSTLQYFMKLKDLGTNLAKIRMAKGLSAYELSLRIDKSNNYISRVESGDVNISIKTLFSICESLEIEPTELFKRN